MEFKHPKYYKELRKRNKLDQAISKEATDGFETSVRSDPGLKLPGPRPISNANKGLIHRRQAASFKLQAASDKLPDSITFIKFQATSVMGLDYDKTILRMPHMEGNLVW